MTFTVDMTKERTLTLAPSTPIQAIEQNIYCLVFTMRGEIPCYRDFGVDIDYMHRPINEAKARYAASLMSAMEKFMPEIQVRKISFDDNVTSSDMLKPIMEVSTPDE